MATISTSQTFDSAARTAGEAFTINSGAVFTIDSDTRDGKNAAAARAGSVGSFTMTAATGGTCLIDGTKVWVIDYDTLQGTPVVPALGSTIRGVTSGATGELMNISASISATPTAAGASMPATGIIKLKSKTGDFQDNEILEISGSTDLCLANGVGKRGWIEVVMDDAAGFTIGRAQKFQITGDWYVNSTTISGSRGQQIQFPNYGGANFFLPGVWVETGVSTDVWEFWPATLIGTGTMWLNTQTTTDARCKFVQCLAGGIVRFGSDGTNNIGAMPTTGARVRIPNVLLKSAATASRASDSVPNVTFATRPDFTTTNAGQIDINGAIGHWYMSAGQAYSVKLYNFAYFDQLQITECATAIDLNNGGNGNYTVASDVVAFVLTSNYAGGTVQFWKAGRSGTIAANDYSAYVSFCNDIVFTSCRIDNRTLRTATTSYPFYAAFCNNLTFYSCEVIGGATMFSTDNNIKIYNHKWSDNYFTAASTTTTQPAINVTYVKDALIDGFTWLENLTGFNPTGNLFGATWVTNLTIRNIGTRAAPLNVGAGANDTTFIYTDGGNTFNVRIQKVYCSNVATRFVSTANNSKGFVIQNCAGDYADTHTGASFDGLLKNFGCASWPVSGASIYGTIFNHIFTSTTAGRIGIEFNEPTATYSSYVTTNFTTTSTGTSGFDSNGGLALINSGDYAIFEFPYLIKGIDSFPNSAPTITTATNITSEFAVNTGGGYGAWTALTGANLNALSVSATTGFYMKFRFTANATNAANILTTVYALTNSNTTAQEVMYPLDTINLSLTGLLTGSDVVIYAAGTETVRSSADAVSSFTYTYETPESVDIGVFKAGYVPFYIRNYALGSTDASLPVAQEADRAYLV